jgi:hypothetical protein
MESQFDVSHVKLFRRSNCNDGELVRYRVRGTDVMFDLCKECDWTTFLPPNETLNETYGDSRRDYLGYLKSIGREENPTDLREELELVPLPMPAIELVVEAVEKALKHGDVTIWPFLRHGGLSIFLKINEPLGPAGETNVSLRIDSGHISVTFLPDNSESV